MKIIFALAALVGLGLTQTDKCTEDKQVACIDDFRAAYPVCMKAAQSGGSDVVADIACIKYYSKVQADCWPCICMIANAEKLNVKGC